AQFVVLSQACDSVIPAATCASAYIYVFFFQAEDGIRDSHVTGVQTCALPILARRSRWPGRRRALPGRAARRRASARARSAPAARSEERRVGKERRSRKSPNQKEELAAQRP